MTNSGPVAIVGGGMVGLATALALAGKGIDTRVLEAAPVRTDSGPGFDDRKLALAAASINLLENLGIWSPLADQAEPIRAVQVSAPGHFGSTRMEASALGRESFGQVVEARRLGLALLDAVEKSPRIQLRQPAKVISLEQTDDEVTLGVAGSDQGSNHPSDTADHVPESLTASLGVACDGATSALRKMAGIGATHHDYATQAVVTNITTARPHQGTAFERLTPNGPLAVLPMSQGRCGVVWCQPHEEAQALLAMDDREFRQRLQDAFGFRLGRIGRIGKCSAWPLHQVLAEQAGVGRVLLAGNAAHTIHPVGAQGLNLGLRDVAAIAQIVGQAGTERWMDGSTDAASGDLASGHVTPAQHYSNVRMDDWQRLARQTHALVTGFAGKSEMALHVRSLALSLLDITPALKRRVAMSGMGLMTSVGPIDHA